ncbi:MAG: hypothetical protein NVS3B23_09630 [Candidatus Saccharimonadales bacterium]
MPEKLAFQTTFVFREFIAIALLLMMFGASSNINGPFKPGRYIIAVIASTITNANALMYLGD